MPKMKRREFLQSAAAAGSSLLPSTGIQTASDKKTAKTQSTNLPNDILPMRSYLAQHDLLYEVAPREWEEVSRWAMGIWVL